MKNLWWESTPGALLFACLLPFVASGAFSQDLNWGEAYNRTRQEPNCNLRIEYLEVSIKQRPKPEIDARVKRTLIIEDYFPYLALAEAYLDCDDLHGVNSALLEARSRGSKMERAAEAPGRSRKSKLARGRQQRLRSIEDELQRRRVPQMPPPVIAESRQHVPPPPIPVGEDKLDRVDPIPDPDQQVASTNPRATDQSSPRGGSDHEDRSQRRVASGSGSQQNTRPIPKSSSSPSVRRQEPVREPREVLPTPPPPPRPTTSTQPPPIDLDPVPFDLVLPAPSSLPYSTLSEVSEEWAQITLSMGRGLTITCPESSCQFREKDGHLIVDGKEIRLPRGYEELLFNGDRKSFPQDSSVNYDLDLDAFERLVDLSEESKLVFSLPEADSELPTVWLTGVLMFWPQGWPREISKEAALRWDELVVLKTIHYHAELMDLLHILKPKR